MGYKIEHTRLFKKDFKKSEKGNKNMELLEKIMNELVNKKILDKKYKDHALKGKFLGNRECHIQPDWLLMYRIDKKDNTIIFERICSHSELFK